MSAKPQVIDQPQAIAPSTALTPMDMLDRAVAQGANVETLEKLMALQERWEKTQARKAFDDAMSAAKAEIPVINKNRTVDFTGKTGIRTNYRHEDMAEIARTVDPILSKHGLSYRYRTSSNLNEPVTVTCIISHRLGHSEENTLSAGRDESGNKNAIQAVGSTVTFLQRYTLKAALGLAASADDDGKGAGDTGPITDEQATTIQELVTETKTDISKFLTWVGAESISDIPASKYDDVVAMLNAKKNKKVQP